MLVKKGPACVGIRFMSIEAFLDRDVILDGLRVVCIHNFL